MSTDVQADANRPVSLSLRPLLSFRAMEDNGDPYVLQITCFQGHCVQLAYLGKLDTDPNDTTRDRWPYTVSAKIQAAKRRGCELTSRVSVCYAWSSRILRPAHQDDRPRSAPVNGRRGPPRVSHASRACQSYHQMVEIPEVWPLLLE